MKRRSRVRGPLLWAVLTTLATGCQSPRPTPLTLTVAPSLADSLPGATRNPLTVEGVALGRALFFDPALSSNGRVSCATCHVPARAFTDGLPTARLGVSGRPRPRHTPALINLAWAEATPGGGLLWDGGVKNLESVAFAPLTHADEMGIDLRTLTRHLQADRTYRRRFRAAFGSDSVTTAGVSRALAQYLRTLLSDQSRYDRWQQGKEDFSADELRGFVLFRQHCASCHPPGLFTDHAYHHTGLDDNFTDPGPEDAYLGRYRITLHPADRGAFKTPTLRNVALTAPYTHDGRFATLDQVVRHYRTGVRPAPNLDPQLVQPDGVPGLPLSEADLVHLQAFLHTLTDTAFGLRTGQMP